MHRKMVESGGEDMKYDISASIFCSNNWLKLHGYAMRRFSGKRKHLSHRECVKLPFQNLARKKKRFRKKMNSQCKGCDCWDKENNTCKRIGINGKVGVCWMEKTEGEY